MPNTVRMGSTGPTVTELQTQLNLKMPNAAPRLAADGIFGPKTYARVVEFQRSMFLAADGIVGPITWRALESLPAPVPGPQRPSTEIECGNGNPGNQNMVMRFLPERSAEPAFASTRSSFVGTRSSFIGSGAPSSIPGLTKLAGSTKEATARTVYGDSLDYDNIFMSPITGAQNRPFTAVLPTGLFPTHFVQVMNLGTSPSDKTLIHELAHCWQSQHHPDPKAFMGACVKCQAAALAKNSLVGLTDPTVRADLQFPVNYPFSAYAYRPLTAFSTYGGEQIAQMVHKGVGPIRAVVKGAAKNAVVADNVTSLTLVTCEDTRDQMVFF